MPGADADGWEPLPLVPPDVVPPPLVVLPPVEVVPPEPVAPPPADPVTEPGGAAAAEPLDTVGAESPPFPAPGDVPAAGAAAPETTERGTVDPHAAATRAADARTAIRSLRLIRITPFLPAWKCGISAYRTKNGHVVGAFDD